MMVMMIIIITMRMRMMMMIMVVVVWMVNKLSPYGRPIILTVG